MTCVLPYRNCNQRRFRTHNLAMPCVFDGCEPLDFESALLSGDWPAQNKDNTHSPAIRGESSSQRATPEPAERSPLKRKFTEREPSSHVSENGTTESKKVCLNSETNSTFSDSVNQCNVENSSQSCSASASCEDENTTSIASHHEVASQTSIEEEDDLYTPRRRVPQMWNSRQRWKDERKKVLKLSVNKLTEIEDPELWLLRSVLINNTIKRLHQDIRTERQAKIRHRQQKMDFYVDRYEPPVPPHFDHRVDDGPSVLSSYDTYTPEDSVPKLRSCPPSDIYDDNSCDEIFSINEDFLRVTIPDRRMSSPIPTSPVQVDDCQVAENGDYKGDDRQADSTSQMDVDQSSSESTSSSTSSTSSSSEDCDTTDASNNENVNNMMTPFTRTIASHQAGSQCATQFRTNNNGAVNNLGVGEVGIFPPRVPILDSVVYHSLLASLESS